ncbi:hypothetical protein [Myxococcus sp. CA039A]|nr:hypothetical protein [Myxococcus sp. CA039A]
MPSRDPKQDNGCGGIGDHAATQPGLGLAPWLERLEAERGAPH